MMFWSCAILIGMITQLGYPDIPFTMSIITCINLYSDRLTLRNHCSKILDQTLKNSQLSVFQCLSVDLCKIDMPSTLRHLLWGYVCSKMWVNTYNECIYTRHTRTAHVCIYIYICIHTYIYIHLVYLHIFWNKFNLLVSINVYVCGSFLSVSENYDDLFLSVELFVFQVYT